MSKSDPRVPEGLKSAILLLFLLGVVGYFAFTTIPSAQRPTLHTPAPTPSHSATAHT